MQATSPPFQILLSAQQPSMATAAEDFIYRMSGNSVEVEQVPFDRLHELQHMAEMNKASLIVVVVAADDRGCIDTTTSRGRELLDSSVPLMVLRTVGDREPSFPDIKRIVVPLDGSATAAQAVPVAARMAGVSGVPVKFVMVIDPSRVLPAAYAYDPEAWGVISDLRQTAHWALRQAEDHLREQGVDVESVLLFGPVNACLMEEVIDGDIVVITTHGSGQSTRRRLGSVAERLVATTPQPIVIKRAAVQGDVIVDGYEACSWVEPLTRRSRV